MTSLRLLLVLLACATTTAAQTKNVTKLIAGDALTENLAVPAGKTLSGAGTFNFGSGAVTLPASVSGGLSSFQTLDATLTALAGTTFNTAGQVAYATGTDTFATITTTTFGRSLWDDADAAAARTTLGLVIGTDVQAYSSSLDTFSSNGSAHYLNRANHTGTQAWSTITSTPTTLSGYGISDTLTTAGIAAAYQPLDTDLTAIAALETTSFGRGLLTYADLATLAASLELDADSVGLGNVEDTALSTWGGSTNLVTVGTITTGEWNGDVIGSGYGGAGAVEGILKADGAGIVSAAIAGTDYLSAGPVDASGLEMSTARLLGRSTADTG
ncbi:MAG TPA: hypothetical protein VHF69_09380, partial [Candidatus Synoicihabitans sp.]|nr:hypothetical protein [Candidatus Synoicihabitans sp.]